MNEVPTEQNSPGDLMQVEQFRSLPPYAISLPQLSSYSQSESNQLPTGEPENDFLADLARMGYSPNSINLVDMITIDGWNKNMTNTSEDFS